HRPIEHSRGDLGRLARRRELPRRKGLECRRRRVPGRGGHRGRSRPAGRTEIQFRLLPGCARGRNRWKKVRRTHGFLRRAPRRRHRRGARSLGGSHNRGKGLRGAGSRGAGPSRLPEGREMMPSKIQNPKSKIGGALLTLLLVWLVCYPLLLTLREALAPPGW